MSKRNDIHSPSQIQPEDYYFVAVGYTKIESLGDVYFMEDQKKILAQHMERTGGKYSTHQNGGQCHVCGTYFMYYAVYYHEATNAYIKVGFDCSAKMDMGDDRAFKAAKDAIGAARTAKAGKKKAQGILDLEGLTAAWELFQIKDDNDQLIERSLAERKTRDWKCYNCNGGTVQYQVNGYGGEIEERTCTNCNGEFERKIESVEKEWAYSTLVDIIEKLVKYGSISEKQMAFLGKLNQQCQDMKAHKEAEAKKKAEERANAEPCPEGRIAIAGEIVSTRWDEGYGGKEVLKLLVKDDRGFKIWGNAPAALHLVEAEYYQEIESEESEQRIIENGHEIREIDGKKMVVCTSQRGLRKGDRVEFTAAITPSNDDEQFGFFKRPTKAKVAELVAA